jgi:acyl-CoA dehydrogenase
MEVIMDFEHSPKVKALQQRLNDFMAEHIYPKEQRYQHELRSRDRWQPTVVIEELKRKARAAGLWNLFLPESRYGAGLTNLEYAPLCEIMGRVDWAAEVFNCSAPDTGNMETLERYGTEEQKRQWLEALLDGAHPLLLCHDRTGGGIVGRHQHREPDRCGPSAEISSARLRRVTEEFQWSVP